MLLTLFPRQLYISCIKKLLHSVGVYKTEEINSSQSFKGALKLKVNHS